MKTESNVYPQPLLVTKFNETEKCVLLTDMDSIVEETTEEGTIYKYQQYEMFTQAPIEYITEKANELLEKLKTKEYNDLAEQIREKRNALLDASDKYMALDRVGLDTSSAIAFLASLKNIFVNNYAKYRQSLRDITKQPNFPYEVTWPEKPKE